MTGKEKFKAKFKKELDAFTTTLEKYVSTDNGNWSVKGFIDVYKNIYTISSDTKIVSKILEIHIFPQILQFADEIGYKILLTEHQNYYPDLTFINKENEEIKFAVDLKTTYRKKSGISSFTLGSHGSYFKERDKKKNIQFPYNQYLGHYCLGVIYTRTDMNLMTSLIQKFIRFGSYKKYMKCKTKRLAEGKLLLGISKNLYCDAMFYNKSLS
jgi:hypothetical protein